RGPELREKIALSADEPPIDRGDEPRAERLRVESIGIDRRARGRSVRQIERAHDPEVAARLERRVLSERRADLGADDELATFGERFGARDLDDGRAGEHVDELQRRIADDEAA